MTTTLDKLDTINDSLNDIKTAVIAKGQTPSGDITTYATAINNIPQQSAVITSLNVTPTTSSQTITASSGTDGYSPVNVAAVTASIDSNITAENIKKDVQILGVTGTYEGSGGGSSTPAERTVKANYYVDTSGIVHNLEDTSSATLSANATSLTANLMQKYQNDTTIEKVDLSAITSIGSSYGLLYMTFKGCTNIVSVDLSALTASGSGMSNTFEGCTGLTNIDLSALANIDTAMGLYNTCKGCIALTVVRFPVLANIAASGMIYMFDSCTGLTDVYFNALTSSSFGANTNQFNKMLNNTTGVTVHFPSNLQAVIGSWSDVTAGFGGTNTTVLFDLTATS